jgi:hypothetical protein
MRCHPFQGGVAFFRLGREFRGRQRGVFDKYLDLAATDDQFAQQALMVLEVADGLQAPSTVAADAMLCVEGMMIRYQMTRDPAVVQFGKRVLTLIEEAATAPMVRLS